MITENKIIKKYLRKLSFNNNKSLNLDDDVYYDNTKKIVFSTDTYEEGIHFIKSKNPENFTKKIFRSSLSDIICKGCEPKVYFLSLSLNNINENWLKKFKSELNNDSKKYGIFLGGGDTVKSNKLSISISVIGNVKNKPILRKNAKLNEDIYVTGNLGNSYLGLLIKKKRKNFGKLNNVFIKSFLNPELPFEFSKNLYKFASSAMDLSDGLIKDLNSLCLASKCGANIDFKNLPFSKNVMKLAAIKKINLKDIFSRGDDYQILFTANKKHRKLINHLSKKISTKVSLIGEIVSGNHVKMTDNNKFVDIQSIKTGYIHKF